MVASMAVSSERPFFHAFISVLSGMVSGCLVAWPFVSILILFLSGGSFGNTLGWALFLSFASLVFGGIPGVLYGTLVYGLLLRYGRAGYADTLAFGLLPSFVAYFMLSLNGLELFLLLYGAPVAICTHAIAKHLVVGANNSLKPNSLRGSA